MTKDQIKIYEEQLKPCPFCGKKATIYQDEWGFNLISCHNTDCPIEPCTTKRDIEQAVKDWNTRIISALSENKATSGEYISKADMERILYSTNNAVRIGELFTELPTYSFPDSAKTDMAKPESDLISRTQAINDYAQCFADEYGVDCGEMFIGVLHQCPTFPDSAENKGDLISRQAVLDELEKWDWQELYLPIHFKQILDDVPSVDNKGEWIATENEEMEIDGYFCSKCDLPMPTDEKTPFCPFCGADMRGKAE